jgi:tRNA (guanine37-N1)-methyltransferase
MKIDILTLFPEMFAGPFNTSMLKKAQDIDAIEIKIHNLRKWTKDAHKTVDDRPYGGGPGMILMVEPIDKALNDLKTKSAKVILTSAKGITYTQQKAQKLSKEKHLIIIAGHYEGVDQRVHDHLIDEAMSIGNYVLTGGEIPAMVIIDSITRLIPGVLGKKESLAEESHSKEGYIEYPQYTRPENYKDWRVPEILLSGNHAEIKKWRKKKSLWQIKKRK